MAGTTVPTIAQTDAPSVLLLAFHFPPLKGSSGLERTLGFCRNLPRYGIRPMVVSANPRAYDAISDERMLDIPSDAIVERCFVLDAARHMSFRGRYPQWIAVPDRWVTWLLGAVPAGWRLIRQHRPVAIWSTYPIATAHWAGYLLARASGLPWVADFRDPMVEHDARTGTDYPSDARLRNSRLRIESIVATRANAMVFCTRGAADIFAKRYPAVTADRIHVIPNGFDEGAFPSEELCAETDPAQIKLVHSGLLYPGPDRDPSAFLHALRGLLDSEPQWRGKVRVVLRASGHDDVYRTLVERLGLEAEVELAAPRPYREALDEMLTASGLLVFQGHPSNPAIPAKLYEYFRARRPILAIVDAEGDTAALLRSERVGTLVPIDDASAIQSGLSEFLRQIQAGSGRVMEWERVRSFERSARTADLARLFGRVAREGSLGAKRSQPDAGFSGRTACASSTLCATVPVWADSASAQRDFFCSGSWFRHFAETAVPQGELPVFIDLEADSTIGRGCLALKEARSTAAPFCRILESLSNYYSCGYGPIEPSLESDTTRDALCSALARQALQYDGVKLEPLDRDEAFAIECEAKLRAVGCHTYWALAYRNWYAITEGLSYSDYLQRVPSSFPGISEKRRKAFLRKGAGTIDITTSGQGLDAALRAYTEIYEASWKVPEPFPNFIPGLVRIAANDGRLRLGTLRMDGVAAATQLWFVADGRALIYKVAYAERFAKLSVGSILTAALIDHVLSIDKVREIDFLSGDDEYKSKWMFARRDRHTLLAFNPRRWRGMVGSLREAIAQRRSIGTKSTLS